MATKKTLTTTSGLDPNIELVGGNGGVDAPFPLAADDTSRTIRTIAGNAYCLTLETGNVQISGSDGPENTPDATIIFNADKQGQYVFIAISSWTHINIDLNTKYVINPLNFKVASLGASSGGGGDSFDPSASRTITGAWVFQSTLQRKTVARPAPTDLLNKEMGDAMYAKLSLLTSAEYTALATKDARTVYVTTDTSKVFIGSVAVNPQ